MKRSIMYFPVLFITTFLSGQDGSVIQVDSEEFSEIISGQDGILIDVRTPSEFKNGHLINSGNLNYYALDFRKNLALLPQDQPIYLYCNTGYRSEKAAEILVKNGYTNVYNLQHGIMEWELSDLPVIVEPDAHPDTDNRMEPSQYYSLINSESLVFFDFYAPWCGPCRKMMPVIDSMKTEYHQEIMVLKVNVDASKKLVRELKLKGVPYLALFQNGKIVFSRNGSISRNELTGLLDKSILNNQQSDDFPDRE